MKDLLNGAAEINPPEFQADLRTLLLAQKTELFSEITRATANQFNNTMMAITSYAELEMRNASPSQRRSLEQVLSNVGKATALVQKLLAFSSKQANSPQPLNLNQVVSGIDNLLEQLTSERVSLIYQFEKSLPMVMAEMADVEQVTLGLAIIARNAMQAGGEITISTRVVNVTKDAPSESDGEPQGEYVALSIDDTGTGAVAVASTDYSGLDMRVNLSLAAVRGVVKQAGGFVRVKSEPGKGNSFTIHFPALRQRTVDHSNPVRARSTPASRTLLVEVDVVNAGGRLKPGAYVQVHLKMPENMRSLVVPANALLFRREGLQVGIVRDGKAELVRVTPGHDYGDSMEILSGLQPTDDVILSPSDSLTSGTAVQISGSKMGGTVK